MDVFQEQAEQMDVTATFVTGAVFGLFLTLGQTWSNWFHSLSTALFQVMRPNAEVSNVVVDLMSAVVTSIICIFLLIVIIHSPKMICGKRKSSEDRIESQPPVATSSKVTLSRASLTH